MKADITQPRSRSYRHPERPDGAIQVLVIDRVFVMPDASGRVCHLVANKANAIDSGSRLDLVDGRSGPSLNGGLLLDRGCGLSKREGGAIKTDIEPTVRGIVVLIALGRISLAPDVFMWSDVLAFEVVGGAGI